MKSLRAESMGRVYRSLAEQCDRELAEPQHDPPYAPPPPGRDRGKDEPDDLSSSATCSCLCDECEAGRCASCSNPDCDDENCEHGDEAARGKRQTPSERALEQMARAIAKHKGCTYLEAYKVALLSPKGQKLYAQFSLERGV